MELNNYGIDFDGPVASDYDFETVDVPEIETNVPEHCVQLIADHQANDIDSYVTLYTKVLRILNNQNGQQCWLIVVHESLYFVMLLDFSGLTQRAHLFEVRKWINY